VVKPLEDPTALIGRHTGPAVVYSQNHVLLACDNSDFNSSTGSRELKCVIDKYADEPIDEFI
jgi:hypothetical protein